MARRVVYLEPMHIQFTLLITWLALSFAAPVGAQSCGPQFAAPSSTVRLFPWPTAPLELLGKIGELAEATTDLGVRTTVERALRQPVPDYVVRQLFSSATMAEIRQFYAAKPVPPGAHHPFNFDYGGRHVLARALVAIRDPDLQRDWMEFLRRDPDPRVRLAAVSTFISWPDPLAREFYVEGNFGNPLVMLAALSGARRLNGKLRWRVIRHFALTKDKSDRLVNEAIDLYEDHGILRAWYDDQIRAIKLGRRLEEFSPEWRYQPSDNLVRGATVHDAEAFDLAILINELNGDQYRTHALNDLARTANGQSQSRNFAADILAFAEMLEIARNYGLSLTEPDADHYADRTLSLTKLMDAAGTSDVRLKLVSRLLDDEDRAVAQGAPPAPRTNWSEDQIKAFERTL